jgi:hypothetical protein
LNVKRTMNKEDEELVERMLQHKRMVSTMETWNGKVTEYRRWYLRRQERASDVPDFATENSKKKKISSRGMFVCLGGATIEEEEGYGYYGPGGDEEDEYAAIVQKKNRPGQRTRKAKALAIQASPKRLVSCHSLAKDYIRLISYFISRILTISIFTARCDK